MSKPLSRRWRAILVMYAKGISRPKIAAEVRVCRDTVERCVASPEGKAFIRELERRAEREVVVMLARRELRRILRCIPKG